MGDNDEQIKVLVLGFRTEADPRTRNATFLALYDLLRPHRARAALYGRRLSLDPDETASAIDDAILIAIRRYDPAKGQFGPLLSLVANDRLKSIRLKASHRQTLAAFALLDEHQLLDQCEHHEEVVDRRDRLRHAWKQISASPKTRLSPVEIAALIQRAEGVSLVDMKLPHRRHQPALFLGERRNRSYTQADNALFRARRKLAIYSETEAVGSAMLEKW